MLAGLRVGRTPPPKGVGVSYRTLATTLGTVTVPYPYRTTVSILRASDAGPWPPSQTFRGKAPRGAPGCSIKVVLIDEKCGRRTLFSVLETKRNWRCGPLSPGVSPCYLRFKQEFTIK